MSTTVEMGWAGWGGGTGRHASAFTWAELFALDDEELPRTKRARLDREMRRCPPEPGDEAYEGYLRFLSGGTMVSMAGSLWLGAS